MQTEYLMPKRQTIFSAGYDFHMPYDVDLKPGEWTKIDTGVKFDGSECVKSGLDDTVLEWVEAMHWFMMLVPRSGLGSKYGFRMRNTIGIVDQDYRDNILATVTVDKPLSLKRGDRFMQGIIIPCGVFTDEEVPVKERAGGYGSTGRD